MSDVGAGRSGTRASDRATRLAALGMLALAALALGGCQIGVLHPRGPIGEGQKTILVTSLLIMLAVVVPTIVATLGFAWWFRASNPRAVYRPTFSYSGRVELVTWSIPVLVVLFLGGIAWVGSHTLDPARPLDSHEKPLEIEVVSLDWKWLFILPEQRVAAVNELVVPVGRPLAFRLTSASVMNAFFVPQLGGMIYTMNAMATRLHLQADHEGTYAGLSSHFSGEGFAGMHFAVRAVAPAAFDGWVAEAGRSADRLDRAAYEALAKPSANVAPRTFREVEDGLFASLISQDIPPAPGPAGSVAQADGPLRTADAICTPSAPFGRRAVSAAPPRPRG